MKENFCLYPDDIINACSVIIHMLDMQVEDNERKIIIGRPKVCIVIDIEKSIIMGISIGYTESPYKLIRAALHNCKEDKVSLCLKHDIQIKQDEWQTSNIPPRVIMDYGYITSKICIQDLMVEFNISIVTNNQRGQKVWLKDRSERTVANFNKCVILAIAGNKQENKSVTSAELISVIYKAVIAYNKVFKTE